MATAECLDPKETIHVGPKYKLLLIYSTTLHCSLVVLGKLHFLGSRCSQESSHQVLVRLTRLLSAIWYFFLICCAPHDCVWTHRYILSVFFIFCFALSQSGCTWQNICFSLAAAEVFLDEPEIKHLYLFRMCNLSFSKSELLINCRMGTECKPRHGYLPARPFQCSHSGLPKQLLNVTVSCWRCRIGFFSALCTCVCSHSNVSRVWHATVAVSGYLTCLARKWWQTKTMYVLGTVSSSLGKRKKTRWNILVTTIGEVSQEWWGFTRIVRFTEAQNGWGWNGPLDVIWSNPPAHSGPPTTGCPGLCLGSFWICSRWENLPWLFLPIVFISNPGCSLNHWAARN